MKSLSLTATATLKTFVNKDGEEIEFVDIKTDIDGIAVALALKDGTAKSLLKQKILKGGE